MKFIRKYKKVSSFFISIEIFLHYLKVVIIHDQRILTRCKFEYLKNDIFHLKGLAMFSMTQQILHFFINSFFTNNYTTCNFTTTLFLLNLHAWVIFIDRATKSFVRFMTKKRYNTSLFI